MTAPAILNANTNANSSTITVPSGVTSGQLIIVTLIADTNSVVTITDGAGGTYTEIKSLSSGPDGFRFTIWYKVSAGSDSGATLTFSTGGAVCCQVWGGADATTPIGAFDSDQPASFSSPFTATVPSITTTVADSVLFYAMQLDTTSEPSTTVFTVPSGFTNRYEPATGTFNHLCVSDKVQTSAGASGSLVGSAVATVSGQIGAIAFVINPTAVTATLDTLTSPLVLGSSATFTTTGLGTITTATVGGVSGSSISGPSGDGTFLMTPWVEGAVGIPLGTSLSVILGDGSTTASATRDVNAPSSHDWVLITSVNTSPAYLGGQVSLYVNDQVKFRTATDLSTTTNYIGADGSINTTFSGSQTLQVRRYATGLVDDIILISGSVTTAYTRQAHGLFFPKGRAKSIGGGIFYKRQAGDAGYLVNKKWFFESAASAYTLTASAGSYTYTGKAATIAKTRVVSASAGSYAYTGKSATLLKSKLVTGAAGSYAYTGKAATITYAAGYRITASAGSYAYTGQSATILKTKLLAASAGSYSYSGVSATILKSKILIGAAGAYAYTGKAATLLKTRIVTAASGAYAYTGKAATISYSSTTNYTLTASAGSYAYTGKSATILKSRIVSSSAGSYTYTGINATVLKTRIVVSLAGAYAYSGQSAQILRSKLITASAGAYVYSGKSATIARGIVVQSSSGSYTMSGKAAIITLNRILSGASGSYLYTGINAAIIKSGASYPEAGRSIYVKPELTAIYVRPESTTIEAD